MAMACDCERAVPALQGFHMLNSKALTKWELDNGSLISSIGMWRSPCGVFAGIYAHLYESMQQGQPSEMPIRIRDPTCATVFVVTAAAYPEWPYLQLTQMSSLTRHFKHVCGGPVEEGDVLIFSPHGDGDTAIFDVCLRRGCTSAQPPRSASEDLCLAELEPEGRAEAAAACECSSSSQGTSNGWGTGEGTAGMYGLPDDLGETGSRSVEQRSPQVPTPASAALGAPGTRPATRTGARQGGGDSPDAGSPNAHGDAERQGQSDEVCYHKLVPSNVACKSIQFTAHMMRTVFKDLRTDPTTTAFTLSLDPRDPQHRQEQQQGGQQQERQQGSDQQTSWKIRLNDHRKRRTYGYGFGPVQERLRYGAGSVLAFRRDTSGPLRYFVRLLPGDAASALAAEAAAAARAADPAATGAAATGAASAPQQQQPQQHPASAAACSGPATPTQRHPGRPGAASNHPGSALPEAQPRGAVVGKRVGSSDEAHVRDNGTTTAEPQAAAAAAAGPGTAEAEGGQAARPAKQRRVDAAASAGGVAAAGGSSPDDLICFRKIMNYNMKHRRVKFTQDMLSTAFKPLLDDPTMMAFTLLLDSERDPHPLPGGSGSCHGGGGNGGGDGSSQQPSPDPQPSWQITVGRHDKKGNTVGYGYGPVQQHLGYKPGDVVRFRRDPHDPSRYYIRLVSNLSSTAAAAAPAAAGAPQQAAQPPEPRPSQQEQQ
ncbi:hypothetical protein Agub_g9732 [Astrephomene gubernaculifera]|uniref:Uncharacterized protein n=1 Tax=Astrephomene gubernaculifera TaxID=47775 RepID=A0AAD3HNH6_9CHLO|nr:hypothetical protein Agub_g9732 [Astrephomene gubernaculifera]